MLNKAFSGALAAVAVAITVLAPAPAWAHAEAGQAETVIASCLFTAPTPIQSGSNVVATANITGCPASARWTLTIQRHRSGAFWQNLGSNWRDDNGSLETSTGCGGAGWRTYRSILKSNQGHQSVSGHHRFYC